MLGKINFNITRGNKDKVVKEYRMRLYIFTCACILVLILLPFANLFNKWMKLFPDLSYAPKDNLTIHTVDVGQGLCIMLNLPDGTNMILDTGVREAWNSVDKYIDNVLLRNGGKVDYLIISHADADHAGNAKYILDKYKPKNVYIPKMLTETNNGVISGFSDYYDFYSELGSDNQVNYNYAGNELRVGEVTLTWLAPNRDYYSSSNDYSAVILIQFRDFALLFTADAGHNTGLDNRVNIESEFLSYANTFSIDLDVDVILVGHHGSKYSTSIELLDATMPEVALISVSADNTYGHPADEVFDNILEYDNKYNKELLSNTFATKDKGNIIISTAGTDYIIDNISNIHDYLFISFVVVDIVIFVPLVYYLLDAIIIYRQLTSTMKPKK